MRVSVWTAATLAWTLLAGGACLVHLPAALSGDVFAEALSAQAEAQRAETEPAAADKAGKELHALRVSPNTVSIRVDGRVDDEAWMGAQVISDFTQEDPDNMMPPTESTSVRVAYDDRYLYVAVQMAMRDVVELRDGLGRRGSAPPSDRMFIAFDTAHDHQNAYVFEVNASGVQNDYLQVADTGTNNDYEAVWEVATLQTGQGWNAEFRIPFSQMRFPAQSGNQTVWGLNIRRDVFARGEQDWWVAKPRGAQGVVSRFGHLLFDDRLTPPRRLEFTPYVLGQLQAKSGEPSSGAGNAGFDLRVGLGPSASLSATVNPDFGQVEADPSVLNLSVFETFFPEKRPFFLEDSQTFVLQFGQFPDFYSRRIGQRPDHFELADNETLVTKPDTTTIFGAVKLTGKTSRWNYGALTAVTSREYGYVDVTSDAANAATLTRRQRKLIEPRSIYSVARVSRNLLGDTSNVGLIATNVTRELDGDASLAGVDATLRRDRNRFNLMVTPLRPKHRLTASCETDSAAWYMWTTQRSTTTSTGTWIGSRRLSGTRTWVSSSPGPTRTKQAAASFCISRIRKASFATARSTSSAAANGMTITCPSADGRGSTETSTSRTSGMCSSGLSVAPHSTTTSAHAVAPRFCRPPPAG